MVGDVVGVGVGVVVGVPKHTDPHKNKKTTSST